MITTRRFEAEISVDKYFENYVDVEGIAEKCEACDKHAQYWCCAPFDFDVADFWNKYNDLFLLAMRIKPDPKYRGKKFEGEELEAILTETLNKGKELLAGELYVWEKKMNGVALSAGACTRCTDGCTRPDGPPCRYADEMRYNLESLGADVNKTITDVFGLQPLWVEDGVIPEYFILVSGLLYNPKED